MIVFFMRRLYSLRAFDFVLQPTNMHFSPLLSSFFLFSSSTCVCLDAPEYYKVSDPMLVTAPSFTCYLKVVSFCWRPIKKINYCTNGFSLKALLQEIFLQHASHHIWNFHVLPFIQSILLWRLGWCQLVHDLAFFVVPHCI